MERKRMVGRMGLLWWFNYDFLLKEVREVTIFVFFFSFFLFFSVRDREYFRVNEKLKVKKKTNFQNKQKRGKDN